MFKNILCKIGIHRPLTGHLYLMRSDNKIYYDAMCPYGKLWKIKGRYKWFGKKEELKNELK